MAAINGVKKSAIVKKSGKGKFGILAVIISVVITLLIAALAVVLFWKYYYQEQFTNQVISTLESGQTHVYVATRDIARNEYIDGAVELVVVPSSIINDSLLMSGDDLSNLKASLDIKANSIISENNTFDPDMQNPVLSSTREYEIDYLETPGIQEGDFIDIRLKTYNDGEESSYEDKVVASKIEILSKTEKGSILIRLSEADILNLNSAVIEAAGNGSLKNYNGAIYVGRYVDPANQPKATVTYNGAGIKYTQEELLEAQQILRDEMNGTNNTEVTDDNTNDVGTEEITDDTFSGGAIDDIEIDPIGEGEGTIENTEGGQG